MVEERNKVIETLGQLLQQLKQKHDIRAAFLFGSYAHGNPKEYSDIDLAVVLGKCRNGSPFDERFEIFHEVQQQNSLVEVVCLTQDEFDRAEETLIRYIRREGIKIL